MLILVKGDILNRGGGSPVSGFSFYGLGCGASWVSDGEPRHVGGGGEAWQGGRVRGAAGARGC